MKNLIKEFKKSVCIMNKLRSKKGCPWDREQTVESLKKYVIEEAYEVVEALDSGESEDIKEELGDLFFQVLFQAEIAKEKEKFQLADVLRTLNEKMQRRHPHVFKVGAKRAKNSNEVLLSWARTKKEEGKKSVLEGVPKKMPALLRAYRTTEKAAGVGFDWKKSKEILDKLEEEIVELKNELKRRKRPGCDSVKREIGDILFTVVNISRFLKIDPESALRCTISKFERRFMHIEKGLKKLNKDIRFTSLAEMEELWNEAKQKGIQ